MLLSSKNKKNEDGSPCTSVDKSAQEAAVPSMDTLIESLTLGKILPKIVKEAAFTSLVTQYGHCINFFATPGLLRMKIYQNDTTSGRFLRSSTSLRVIDHKVYLRRHNHNSEKKYIRDISTDPVQLSGIIGGLHHLGSTQIRIDQLTAKLIRQFLKAHGITFSLNLKSKSILTETLVKACYPIFRHVKLNLNHPDGAPNKKIKIPTMLARNLRELPEIKKFTRRTYKAFSRPLLKDMVIRFETLDLDIARYIYLARGFFNHDEFARLVVGKSIETGGMYGWEQIDPTEDILKFLAKYPKERAKKILIGVFEADLRTSWAKSASEMGNVPTMPALAYLMDTVRQYTEFEAKMILPEKPKSVKELHGAITTQYRKLSTEDVVFEFDDTLKAVDGKFVADLEIVVPKSKFELIDWGTRLNNCIASYAKMFANRETILLGIKRNGSIMFNVEIRNKEIVQFMGNYNTPENGVDRVAVENALRDLEILKAA
jgi:hypothetical protein